MTGTAMTEEEEFSEIYKLDIVEIPTTGSVRFSIWKYSSAFLTPAGVNETVFAFSSTI